MTRANDGETMVRVDEDLGTSTPSHLSLCLGSFSLTISTPSLSLPNNYPFTLAKHLFVITDSKHYSQVKPALLATIQKD